ncbi:hypothetical protein AVHY2522_03065 [Acidovorax sp. SUPP2522]|uniref:hypothetical protein n=1 Tax=unclassified Acidovorax TaxID=2684926 RepID=UPI00234B3FDA|nr:MULTISPECIES: hypothetical protein [unclassified Acidovorax]WCM98477.1 hypothetical protein M5C96_03160 [Acidovorax sp. GBBC 1281]GKT14015.1 hypothetical protein AVHY2522_03065 [Acidovorax sp. SUPP2522]
MHSKPREERGDKVVARLPDRSPHRSDASARAEHMPMPRECGIAQHLPNAYSNGSNNAPPAIADTITPIRATPVFLIWLFGRKDFI